MITKDNAKQWLPLVQAMAEGKTIQGRLETDRGTTEWFFVTQMSDTDFPHDYRIKPEPKLRAWTHRECPQLFIVQNKSDRHMVRIAVKQSGYDHVRFWNADGEIGNERYSFDDLMSDWLRVNEYGDESPCGVIEDQP